MITTMDQLMEKLETLDFIWENDGVLLEDIPLFRKHGMSYDEIFESYYKAEKILSYNFNQMN